ncbi:DUF3039 domain-containing protein [Occultella gossypii]|uniref:DUF3039 domain-containing protein n=1 Tax=Occultella gossypii TaxID=2800820 RepID=A0ABS7S7M9_9MICO|nr:DUF3039 domain-containing protein [Occultella gossypii]MBZ2196265.1 DUF3039 domain-containing protein [Occultella gossypii]
MSEPLPPTQPQETERLSSGTGTDVLERAEVREEASPGDAERYAHYVKKEKITASAVSGAPVIALCGKVWTPNRDPSKFPICPACKEIFEGLTSGGGGKDGAGSESGGKGRGFFGFGSKK